MSIKCWRNVKLLPRRMEIHFECAIQISTEKLYVLKILQADGSDCV